MIEPAGPDSSVADARSVSGDGAPAAANGGSSQGGRAMFVGSSAPGAGRTGPPDSLRRASADFPANLSSAGQARTFVGLLCRNWGVPQIVLDAEMVVSELVENAVRHSGSGCDVTVELGASTLTIGVTDHGASPPRLLRPPPDRPGGRGLLLVNTVSRRWGFQPTADGKLVWADLAIG